jgi:hypothetical protein
MSVDATTHRQAAIEANNSTWEILAKQPDQISADEAEEMTRRAYAAAYHWQRAEGATPTNAARAEWLLSRVWSVRRVGQLALAHAERCLDLCQGHSLVDFDLAYAYEAMARAHAVQGEVQAATHYRQLALGVAIAGTQDRRLFESDLAAEPWFGLLA